MPPEMTDSWDALANIGRRQHLEMTAARHWEKLNDLEMEEFETLPPEMPDSWDALANIRRLQHVELTAARHWEKL